MCIYLGFFRAGLFFSESSFGGHANFFFFFCTFFTAVIAFLIFILFVVKLVIVFVIGDVFPLPKLVFCPLPQRLLALDSFWVMYPDAF